MKADIKAFRAATKTVNSYDALFSPRGLEVMRAAAKGLTTKETADLMHIDRRTVSTHKERIRIKMADFGVEGMEKFRCALLEYVREEGRVEQANKEQ